MCDCTHKEPTDLLNLEYWYVFKYIVYTVVKQNTRMPESDGKEYT